MTIVHNTRKKTITLSEDEWYNERTHQFEKGLEEGKRRLQTDLKALLNIPEREDD